MDVFGKGTDEPSRPLMSPAVCFICENSPTQEAERVIDTTREFNPECLTRLSGRKYVCEGCATEFGKAMGQVSSGDFRDLEAELADTQESLARVNAELADARTQQHRVVPADDLLAALLAVAKPESA